MEMNIVEDILDKIWFLKSVFDRFPDEGRILRGKKVKRKKRVIQR